MAFKPAALDHVNIYVRNAERSHRWYTEVFGLHTQDIAYVPGDRTSCARRSWPATPATPTTSRCSRSGEDAPGPQKGQVGLNHVAWRMESLDDLDRDVPAPQGQGRCRSTSPITPSRIGVYFSDPDGNGLEVYYELPRSQWKRERPFTGATPEEKGRFPGPWDEVLRGRRRPPRREPDRAAERRAQAARRHPAQHDVVGAHERRQRPQRVRHARQRRVLLDRSPPAGRRLPRREPGLEVHVAHRQPALGAVALASTRPISWPSWRIGSV